MLHQTYLIEKRSWQRTDCEKRRAKQHGHTSHTCVCVNAGPKIKKLDLSVGVGNRRPVRIASLHSI